MHLNLCTQAAARRRRRLAMTLTEVMVALAIGSVVLAIVAVLIVFAARSFAALANYQVLDQASSITADTMSQEIREATAVVSFVNTGAVRHMLFSNTIAATPYTVRFEWSEDTQELTMKRSLDAESRVLLTGCERWDFEFYQRTPLPAPGYGFSTNIANQSECKLVSMTWKCARPLLGTKLINTESVQTAQIVLRNQRTP